MTPDQAPPEGQLSDAADREHAPPTPPVAPRGPLASLGGERFDLAEAIGGARGIVDGALPSVAFVAVYGVTQRLDWSIITAVAIGAVLLVLRLVRREPLQQAIGGFVAVAFCAFIAQRTGRAEDYFLPSLLKNAAWAAGYLVSIVVRWPLLGVLVGPLLGEGWSWRRDPARLRAYMLASWLWVAMFVLRAAVQYPLWAAGQVGALGVVSVVLGLPLFALICWLSYLILRRVPVTAR